MPHAEVVLPISMRCNDCTVDESVATYNFFLFRVPNDKLLVTVFTEVKLVEIYFFTRSAVGRGEGDFS